MGAEIHETLNLAVGVLQIALGLVVLRHVRRLGRVYPWLAALMILAFARGADRLYVGASGASTSAVTLVADALVVAMLVVLIAALDRMITSLSEAEDEARGRAREYGRALEDYRALMRHRIANRVGAVRGAITTLSDADLDAAARADVLRMLDDEARKLEEEALDERLSSPQTAAAAERVLRARPRRRFRRLHEAPPATAEQPEG